jgi:XapX domain-containing protein
MINCLLSVRSTAPPLVALVGLLGILLGEQIIPVGTQFLCGTAFTAACEKAHSTHHVLGQVPGRHAVGKVSEKARA